MLVSSGLLVGERAVFPRAVFPPEVFTCQIRFVGPQGLQSGGEGRAGGLVAVSLALFAGTQGLRHAAAQRGFLACNTVQMFALLMIADGGRSRHMGLYNARSYLKDIHCR